jgi:hypothetical protein
MRLEVVRVTNSTFIEGKSPQDELLYVAKSLHNKAATYRKERAIADSRLSLVGGLDLDAIEVPGHEEPYAAFDTVQALRRRMGNDWELLRIMGESYDNGHIDWSYFDEVRPEDSRAAVKKAVQRLRVQAREILQEITS